MAQIVKIHGPIAKGTAVTVILCTNVKLTSAISTDDQGNFYIPTREGNISEED